MFLMKNEKAGLKWLRLHLEEFCIIGYITIRTVYQEMAYICYYSILPIFRTRVGKLLSLFFSTFFIICLKGIQKIFFSLEYAELCA